MAIMDELFIELTMKEVDPTDLDELVHEAKSCEAASINNRGLYSQVGYLVEKYGLEQVRVMTEYLLKK